MTKISFEYKEITGEVLTATKLYINKAGDYQRPATAEDCIEFEAEYKRFLAPPAKVKKPKKPTKKAS